MISGERREFDTGGARLAAIVQRGEDAAAPPVVLLAGWPQSTLAWRGVMPPLVAAGRTVYAVDPRGFGASEAPPSGYDLDTVAGEIAAVLAAVTGDRGVDLVGHDVGSWIAHAVGVRRPASLRSLTLVDAAIPGVTPEPTGYPEDDANVRSWHFGFNRLPELPELLLRGHEREFLEWSFRHKSTVAGAIPGEVVDEYARLLSEPARRHAGFEYYREIFGDTGRVAASRRGDLRIAVPLLTIGASHGVRGLLYDALRERADRISGVVLDCGHYVPEERPRELARALLDFWSAI